MTDEHIDPAATAAAVRRLARSMELGADTAVAIAARADTVTPGQIRRALLEFEHALRLASGALADLARVLESLAASGPPATEPRG